MKKKNFIKVVIIIVLLILVDQGIKLYVGINKTNFELIHGFLSINYVENTGSAFGIGSGSLLTIIISNFIVLGIVIKFLVTQFERIDKLTRAVLYIVLAGGFSNLFDRIIRGFVVDYIDINAFLKFPVFNLADIYIVLGWIMLIFLTIKCAFRKEQKNERKNCDTRCTDR